MKKVLWLGPIVPPQDIVKYKAVSVAANVWQLGFIDGLIENEVNVTLVSYVPYPTWPKGPIWATKPLKGINNRKLIQYFFGYLNIVYIREIWIAIMIINLVFKKRIELNNHFVFSYNPYTRHTVAARCLRLLTRCKWVSIIADNKNSGNPDFYLFLSYDYFKRFKKRNKLFCDGGIVQRIIAETNNKSSLSTSKKSLIFAGGLNNWNGIIDFVDFYNELDIENFVLHIYGQGDQEILKNKKKVLDNEIILHGFVSDTELDQACRNAYAFINPRPLHMFRSENNFPSKLLLYLSYNKPVISTKTKGLSPDYDNILLYYSDSETFKNCIEFINNYQNWDNIVSKISLFNPNNTWFKKVLNIITTIGM